MFYFSYYFTEIRKRLIYIGISWGSCFLISYLSRFELMYFIGRPFLEFQNKFIFLDLTEAFYTLLRICGGISLVFLFPYCLYQFWSFFIPSRYLFERIQINFVCKLFLLFFFVELFTIYSFLFPKVCQFLMGFEMNIFNGLLSIELSARIQSYTSLVTKFFFFCLLTFQLPFLFVLLYQKKSLSCYQLCKNRRFLLSLSIFISAFFSPPDLLSQLILTLCFLLLYEFLIVIGFFFEKPVKKKSCCK